MAFKKGNENIAKNAEVRKKLRENHWSKNPKYNKVIKKKISETHKNKKLTTEQKKKIGDSSRGKTYEERYGNIKGKQLRKIRSKCQKGRIKSEMEKQNISNGLKGLMVGNKNPAYIDGNSISGGEKYNYNFTKELKTKIRKRDNFVCQICKKNGWCVHHIDYNKLNNNELNLISLCNICHGKTQFNREYWMEYFTK